MEDSQKKVFLIFLGMSQAIAIVMVVLVIVWTSKTLEGFAWDGTSKEFNLHPLCMICGYILLYGEAILSFRVFSQHDKRFVKVIHGFFHLIAFVTAVVGIVAVFDFHNSSKPPIPNMYSLHSWCGMIAFLLFCLQYVFGFVTFLFPGLALAHRQFYLPIHKYFGLSILFMMAMASISGITEKLFFKFPSGQYSKLPYGAVIGNCLGLSILAFIMVVGYIVYNPKWKREEDSENEPLSVHFKPISTNDDGSDDE
uniref:cytochrome b561-like n=1 Tax=Styela clava TaxID=7725 RepID=UPI00193ABF40|nr:cytochrome b561-like [Styela clava]